ncbi:hypothetical protein DL95DRAFT_245681, partial [Leptodontidium sp. 2 PMI_412]
VGFQEGGQYLPGDYVDEGKLLLFIKDEVASRAPRKGQRLKAEQAKRKRERERERERLGPGPGSRPAKRRRGALSPRLEGSASSTEDDEGVEDDEPASDLLLLYNSVRGY